MGCNRCLIFPWLMAWLCVYKPFTYEQFPVSIIDQHKYSRSPGTNQVKYNTSINCGKKLQELNKPVTKESMKRILIGAVITTCLQLIKKYKILTHYLPA
jgi:hypothetical protein